MPIRKLALGLATFAAGSAALAFGAVALANRREDGRGPQPGTTPVPDNGPTSHVQPAPTGEEGHAAPDLAADQPLGPDHRAPEAFRPDIDAPMTAAEREALRPATGPSPSLVADEGGSVQGVGGELR